MTGKNDILQELRSLSELVASIGRQTPYRVADDYFTDLSTRTLLRCKTHHKPMAFNVPEGYFASFAGNVLARIKGSAQAGSTIGAASAGQRRRDLVALPPRNSASVPRQREIA